jgi:para-nitrobenzyl esterase
MWTFRGLEMTFALSLALVGTAVAQSADPSLVTVESGVVRGVTAGDVISFKGIPYAAPPVGALRWRMPQPAKPWPGTLAADKFGPACMQTETIAKSEDCLTLNVWRPAAAPAAPLPVMVWVYGGALMHGRTSLYPLEALAKQGVVAVSMNYRMGRFGFFAHPALAAEAPDDVRGNYGHMDQRAALQWVQRNIAAFGGDPSKVTIFGESAGGGSVLVHLASPLSRGLFHRAILQSPGVPTARAKVLPVTELADAEKIATDYARSFGLTIEGAGALTALRAVPAAKLVEAASAKEEIDALSAGRHVAGFAGAIRDGKLIVDAPEAILAAGRQAMVPVVIGANDRDLYAGLANSKDELFANFGADAAEARKAYDPRGDQTLDELKQQVLADRTLVEPARHLADEMARAGQPVWLYRFGYVSQAQRGTNMGTLHGFEIPFTLNLPGALVGAKVTAADKAMADLASDYWVAFGKTGDPNGEGRPVWPRHDPAIDRIIHFTNTGVIVGTDPLMGRLDLWQKVVGVPPSPPPIPIAVTLDNFIRAETDLYFGKAVKDGAFGKLRHRRDMASIDQQDVVRMNRDTLYSSGVFDLEAAPLTVTLPDAAKRFMSMQVVSQDHYTTEVVYAPGRYSYSKDKVGTRYVFIIVRTLADPQNPDDVKAANALQDAIKVEQAAIGKFEVPSWDTASQDKVRDALSALATVRGNDTGAMFGSRSEVDPIAHLIGTAVGWGGNPRSAAIYLGVYPKDNGGKTAHKLTVKDVPVDGFWSISVYDAKGYFEKNDRAAYSVNNLTAKPNPDGSVTVQFGGCRKDMPNCLPIMAGWNYTVRLYRPRRDIVDGTWKFPQAQASN